MDDIIKKLKLYKNCMDNAELRGDADRYFHCYAVIQGYLYCLFDLNVVDRLTYLHLQAQFGVC